MWGNLTKINVASHLLFFFRVHLFWRKKNNNISLGEFFNKKKLCLSVNSPRKKKDMNENFLFPSTSHKHNVSSKWAKFHIHSFMNTIIYCVTCVIANPIYFHQKFCGIFSSWFYRTNRNFWVHIAQCAFIQSKTKIKPYLKKKMTAAKSYNQKKATTKSDSGFFFFVMIQLHAE